MKRISIFTGALVCLLGALVGSRFLHAESSGGDVAVETPPGRAERVEPPRREEADERQAPGQAKLQRELEALREQFTALRARSGMESEPKKARLEPKDLPPEQLAEAERIWNE